MNFRLAAAAVQSADQVTPMDVGATGKGGDGLHRTCSQFGNKDILRERPAVHNNSTHQHAAKARSQGHTSAQCPGRNLHSVEALMKDNMLVLKNLKLHNLTLGDCS